jgi:hypothetical protein
MRERRGIYVRFYRGFPWRPAQTLEWHKAGREPTRPVRRGR